VNHVKNSIIIIFQIDVFNDNFHKYVINDHLGK
jgi:hypothetical protein